MNSIKKKIFNCGIVPVVVIENAKDAVPTAKALLAGGIDVIEVTMRTEAGLQAIENISKECPDVLVGAGTVLSEEKCKLCTSAGARFIVSPGFDPKVVEQSLLQNVMPVPGCVTPTEIQQAMQYNLDVLKFFPANIYGGTEALKAFGGPFEGITFIPTGGVNEQNISDYAAVPNVFAIGGSWVCTKNDIAAHEFDKMTALASRSRMLIMGFEFAHLGINTQSEEASLQLVNLFEKMFGFQKKLGSSSNFSSESIEVMKQNYLGKQGHLAVRTNNIMRAIAYLESKGLDMDPSTTKYKNGKMNAVYLKAEFANFALHLLQK